MKLATLTSAVLLLAAAPLAMAQTSTWKSDPAHSEVDFTIKHMALSNVHGRFGTVDATLTWDEQDPTKSTVNATIDVTGVDTTGPVTGMNKKLHVGFSATTTLNREDFGIGAGMPVAMLGDDVKLTIELDFVKQ
jgi:polyisoprenoid-binding protein YceI